MSILDRIRAKRAEATPTPPPPSSPSEATPVTPENPKLSEIERQSLRDTIKHCDARMDEIDAVLKAERLTRADVEANPERDTERAQTMRREWVELMYDKARADTTLRGLTPKEIAGKAKGRRRDEFFLDLAVRERTEVIMATVAKYEKQGEWGQARVWRNELVGLRATIAREMNLINAGEAT